MNALCHQIQNVRVARAILSLLVAWTAAASLAFSEEAGGSATHTGIEFSGDVRPILAKACFRCHGPDEESREGGFRLDRRDSAVGEADSGERPIVPGRPEKSEVVRRITAEDEAERMPPPESGLSLTAAQIEVIRRWIAVGAPYSEHWSFVPPRRPQLPVVRRAEWVRNPIDRFILARLERERLAPAPEAD
ncbi:MAG: hypothetical protein GXP27_09355, partial [Planctomycetes bacterium]|nr:hypothetical protein [Planctomycetota bacterium]